MTGSPSVWSPTVLSDGKRQAQPGATSLVKPKHCPLPDSMAANVLSPSIAALRPAARSRVAAKAAAKPVAVASSEQKEVSRRAALSLGAVRCASAGGAAGPCP